MNLTTIMASLGMGDGDGNTSSTRVAFIVLIFAVILPKVILAIKSGTVPQWDEQDAMILSVAFGGKLIQNHQENKTNIPHEQDKK